LQAEALFQKLLARVRKAVEDYDMIQEGDRIAVGVSGGKDSLTLLYCLKALQRFYPKKFELFAITISLGNEGFDLPALIDIYENIGIQYHIEDTQIAKIVFDVRNEKKSVFFMLQYETRCNTQRRKKARLQQGGFCPS